MDALEATRKAHQTYLSQNTDRGYAGVLENSGHFVSFLEGRTASQNRESGKAIRKARKKGKPSDSDSGSHGGGHAPPPPTPATGGGGGGGGHPPPAGGHGHAP